MSVLSPQLLGGVEWPPTHEDSEGLGGAHHVASLVLLGAGAAKTCGRAGAHPTGGRPGPGLEEWHFLFPLLTMPLGLVPADFAKTFWEIVYIFS